MKNWYISSQSARLVPAWTVLACFIMISREKVAFREKLKWNEKYSRSPKVEGKKNGFYQDKMIF